jgi:hypothetical protein
VPSFSTSPKLRRFLAKQIGVFAQVETCEQMVALMKSTGEIREEVFEQARERAIQEIKRLFPPVRDKAVRKLFTVRSEALWIHR